MKTVKRAIIIILSLALLVVFSVNAMAAGNDEAAVDSHHCADESCSCDINPKQQPSRDYTSGCFVHGEAAVSYQWTGAIRIAGNELQYQYLCTCTICGRTWYEWF